MPSTYAHYRFGQLVLDKLSASQQLVVQKHQNLYDIGLHGPDILFYYRPVHSNPICRTGYAMHEQPARIFFERARQVCVSKNCKDEDMAYLYGFICHFALDARCHPYVEKYVREKQVSHTRIEVEFDRFLLEKNGIKALKYPLSRHIHPDRNVSEVISPYFENITSENIYEALKSMNFYHRLLHASNDVKRQVLYTGMNIIKQNGFKDQIMLKHADQACQLSNNDLSALMDLAVSDACQLIEEFEKNVWNQQPLSLLYDHTFGEN